MDECLIGGIAACGAGFFTNPLEVAKTRQQLQGELRARGQYTVHYRNVVHAFYTVGRVEGLFALQKGLVPALWYQFFMNGCRLGSYQSFSNYGLTKDKHGNTSVPRCALAGAVAGCIGAFAGSPFYMVKTHFQALGDKSIAVGHQHRHEGMRHAFTCIYKSHGITGLWRGVSGAVSRVMVGSGAQLSTFSKSKECVESLELFHKDSIWNAFLASLMSSVVVVLCMTPFDVVSTRLYNQPTSQGGQGKFYRGVTDCFVKIFRSEGLWGFYKGWGASVFRLAPHTILSLVFWEKLRKVYIKFNATDVSDSPS